MAVIEEYGVWGEKSMYGKKSPGWPRSAPETVEPLSERR